MSPPAGLRAWMPRLYHVAVLMAFVAVVYSALLFWTWSSAPIRHAGSATPVVLLLVLCGWLLRGLRWHYYGRRRRFGVPALPSLLAFFASFAFTATPAKMGEIVKAGLLSTRYGVRAADVTGVLLAERVSDLIAVLLLACGCVAFWAPAPPYLVVSALVVGAPAAFVAAPAIHRPVVDMLERVRPLAPAARAARALLGTAHELTHGAPLAVGLTIAIVAWLCEALAFHVILDAFMLPVSVFTAVSIYGMATLVGAVSMLPGGIGGAEGAMVVLLAVAGVPPAASISAIVATRVATLWLVSLLGFVFMGIWWWLHPSQGSLLPEAPR